MRSRTSIPTNRPRATAVTRKTRRAYARLVFLVTAVALGLFVGIEVLLRKSRDFSPDFLASVLLYGLTVLNLFLLLTLVFVLGRNLVRVLLERRRGVLGARFRLRLLLVFLIMAIAPAMLVLLVGSDLIQQTVDRWFNVDVERILSSSQALGTALRESVTERTRIDARALGREVENQRLLVDEGTGRLRRLVERRARERHLDLVTVLTREGELLAVMDPRLPASGDPAPGEALAEAALLGREAEATAPFGAGELVRVAVPVKDAAGRVIGAVVVSTLLPEAVAAEAREVQESYAKFRKAQTFRDPIKAVYLSLYLFPALLTLFGAVWLSLYLARRITTPLRLVAEGAERIAAGERGVRVDFPSGSDEFAALIASFNRMSERLARSEEEVEFNRTSLTRKNQELEERRRLTETVLETVGTGVVVADHEGTLTAINAAACRLLETDASAVGLPVGEGAGGSGPRRGARDRRAPSLRASGPPGAGGAGPLARTLPPPGRDRGAAPGSAGIAAGGGSRARRPHAADARPEGRGLGRGGAEARPRDQEPAHPHPALGPEDPQGLHQVGPGLREDPDRVQRGHRQGGGRPQGPGGRVRGVRAPARGQPGSRVAPRGHRRGLVPLRRAVRGGAYRAATGRRAAPGAPRRGTDEAGGDQPRRQRHRGHGQEGPRGPGDRMRPREGRVRWSWPTTGPGSPPKTATGCSCPTSRPRSEEAASGSPS